MKFIMVSKRYSNRYLNADSIKQILISFADGHYYVDIFDMFGSRYNVNNFKFEDQAEDFVKEIIRFVNSETENVLLVEDPE